MYNYQVTKLNTDNPFTFKQKEILSSETIKEKFNVNYDSIEAVVYDQGNNIVLKDYDFKLYTVYGKDSKDLNQEYLGLNFNFDEIVSQFNLLQGRYTIEFNFVNLQASSDFNSRFYLDRISSNRTEIKVAGSKLSADQKEQFRALAEEIRSTEELVWIFINFGTVETLVTNIEVNDDIYLKLYTELDLAIDQDFDSFYIYKKSADPVTFDLQVIPKVQDINVLTPVKYLRGPNLDIKVKDQVEFTTNYETQESLERNQNSGSVAELSREAETYRELYNIDLSDFSTFVHFSSAYRRLLAFYQKMVDIENYQTTLNERYYVIAGASTGTPAVSGSISVLQNKINTVIQSFDTYEKKMYYESSSYAWPKVNSTKPYVNASITSSQVLTWIGSNDEQDLYYGGRLLSASLFDALNENNVQRTLPEYIIDDRRNEPYVIFMEMIAHHFDNLWITAKSVTQKLESTSDLSSGISKELIADTLKSFGIKLYESSFLDANIYETKLGYNISGSSILSTGSEVITNVVTTSNNRVPYENYQSEIYKRLYHNIPYLLKRKGLIENLNTLASIYGLPSTLFDVKEYNASIPYTETGGLNYRDVNTQAFTTSGSGNVVIPWENLEISSTVPDTFYFRFKPYYSGSVSRYQAILEVTDGFSVLLEYDTNSAQSGSFSGSIVSDYSKYATLILAAGTAGSPDTASVYLPFLNGEFWNVEVSKTGSNYELRAGSKGFNGIDGTYVQFNAANTLVTGSDTWWTAESSFILGATSPLNVLGNTYTPASASFQDVRYYSDYRTPVSFEKTLANPFSYWHNTITGSLEKFAFRAPLGLLLEDTSKQTSLHTAYTSSLSSSMYNSFQSGLSTWSYNGNYNFQDYKENVFYYSPYVGIETPVKDFTVNDVVKRPSGSVLSSLRRLDNYNDYNRGSRILDVSYSPQDDINRDIVNDLGIFNVAQYLGNFYDANRNTGSFNRKLLDLSNTYFSKYIDELNYYDYIRILKYLDSSLFKLIRDFVPVGNQVRQGVTVKPHILDIQKHSDFELSSSNAYNETGSATMYTVTGSTGGVYTSESVVHYGLSQSWIDVVSTVSGSIPVIRNDMSEYYTGEFSGSYIHATSQSLNIQNPFSRDVFNVVTYDIEEYTDRTVTRNDFLSNINPSAGQVKIYIAETGSIYQGIQGNDTGTIYIKVHRYTKTGLDVRDSLRVLEAFKWQRTLTSYANYNISTISDKNAYFFYELFPDNELIIAPVSKSNASVILEPYVTEDFTLSPYNALYGNVQRGKLTDKYFVVDSDKNQLVAGNLDAILSGSAENAYIQEDNYSITSFRQIRYDGSRTVCQRINEWTPGDSSYGKTPNVRVLQSYFAYFNYIGGTTPELNNKVSVYLKYIIDAEGNVFDPAKASDDEVLGLVRQNFQDNTAVAVQLRDPVAFSVDMSQLNGEAIVDKAGYRVEPVLYTQTGKTTYTSSLIFENDNDVPTISGSIVKDYRLVANQPTFNRLLNANYETILFTGSILPEITAATYNSGSGEYTVVDGTDAQLRIDAEFNITNTEPISPDPPLYADVGLYLFSGSTIIDSDLATLYNQDSITLKVTNGYSTKNPSDVYTVKFTKNGFAPTQWSNGTFNVKQNPLPGTSSVSAASTGSYWLTGSVFLKASKVKQYITGSQYLLYYYGNKQQNISGSGFNNISLPFTVQVGDEIRFENNELKSFKITDVVEPSTGDALAIGLDGVVPTGTNTDFFLLRRFVDDAKYIILDTNKPGGGTSDGYLFAKYTSPRVLNNFERIVNSLQRDNLIE